MPAPAPPSPAKVRTLALFFLSFALAPVEGEDLDDDAVNVSRRPLWLHREFLLDEWTRYMDRENVRQAMGITENRERSLGRNGFLAVLRAVSDAARETEQDRRRTAYDKATEAGRVPDEDERPLTRYQPANATACAYRENHAARGGDLYLLRLCREFAGDGYTFWEELLAQTSGYSVSESLDDLAAEAAALFDAVEVPASAVLPRVEATPEDDDEDQDDEPAAAPVADTPAERPQTEEERRAAHRERLAADELADAVRVEGHRAKVAAEVRAQMTPAEVRPVPGPEVVAHHRPAPRVETDAEYAARVYREREERQAADAARLESIRAREAADRDRLREIGRDCPTCGTAPRADAVEVRACRVCGTPRY